MRTKNAALRRKMLMMLVAVLVLALGGIGEAAKDDGKYIGMERAKAIAFAHAKVSASDVRKFKAELDRDDGRMIYEIEFEVGRMDYEYEIDARTGEIISWEHDDD